MEDLRTLFTGFAIAISLWSLWWSWRGWRESNRPIVTIHAESMDDASGPIRYKLVVTNSGNRPALNVQLWTDMDKLEKALEPGALRGPQGKLFAHVKRCFTADATIPLLIPNSRSVSSFGYSGLTDDGPFWKYRSSIYVDVGYVDIESHSYRHRIRIEIRDTKAFGGGLWAENVNQHQGSSPDRQK